MDQPASDQTPTPPGPSRAAAAWRQLRQEQLAWRVALAATLALPPMLLASRALADGLISLTALLFLAVRLAPLHGRRQLAWAGRPWHALALGFWVWQLGTSIARGDGHQITEAFVLLRLFLFIAALEDWVLVEPAPRRWFGWVVGATVLWIGIECWQQYLTGVNLFGHGRWVDGELTGPLTKPRAGPIFVQLAFPGLLAPLVALLGAPGRARRVAGGVGLALMVLTQVLIGQRMPLLLMGLGLGVVALWLPRLRLPAAIALAAGLVLAGLTIVVSPRTYHKLVVQFFRQMTHFLATQYAQLFERAAVMITAHPWFGLGFDGFRDHCLDRIYWHNLSWLAIANPASSLGCSIHPHNYYLEVATGAGLPGLALFVLLALAWLWRIGRGAAQGGERAGQRVGLFAGAAIILWPIASTTSLFTLPNAGCVVLVIGWGLAEARAAIAGITPARG